MMRRLLAFLTTALFILLTGAVAGLVIAVLGLALASALRSLQSSDGAGLLSFLVDLFFLLIDVLAVSTVAAPDGLRAGLGVAAAISVVYGLVLWGVPKLGGQRWALGLLLALVGAIVAPFSLGATLALYGVAASVGGALFGLLIGFAISKA